MRTGLGAPGKVLVRPFMTKLYWAAMGRWSPDRAQLDAFAPLSWRRRRIRRTGRPCRGFHPPLAPATGRSVRRRIIVLAPARAWAPPCSSLRQFRRRPRRDEARTLHGYRPSPIARILDTPPGAGTSVNPTPAHVALLGRADLPSLAELAEPESRLGGCWIDPRNDGPANRRIGWLSALSSRT